MNRICWSLRPPGVAKGSKSRMSIEQLYTAPIQQLARFEPLRRFRICPDFVLPPLRACADCCRIHRRNAA